MERLNECSPIGLRLTTIKERLESNKERLESNKERLQKYLNEIEETLIILDANPDVLKIIETLEKLVIYKFINN